MFGRFCVRVARSEAIKLDARLTVTMNQVFIRRLVSVAAVPIQIVFASEMVPHPQKAAKGGEDSFFIEPSVLAFGVADGVGGWADAGVDPADYARGIMKQAAIASKAKLPSSSSSSMSAVQAEKAIKQVLQVSWENTHALGSSTALVGCVLPTERKLVVANMGDSGLLVIRPKTEGSSEYSVVFRTQEQQHQFNCPYQLSSRETHSQYPDVLHDLPEKAETSTVNIQPNDIILAATDGVLDNVFEATMTQIAKQSCGPTVGAQECAQRFARAVVAEAHRVGASPTARSPFGVNAAKYGFRYAGGKQDDCTAVVAVVI